MISSDSMITNDTGMLICITFGKEILADNSSNMQILSGYFVISGLCNYKQFSDLASGIDVYKVLTRLNDTAQELGMLFRI